MEILKIQKISGNDNPKLFSIVITSGEGRLVFHTDCCKSCDRAIRRIKNLGLFVDKCFLIDTLKNAPGGRSGMVPIP